MDAEHYGVIYASGDFGRISTSAFKQQIYWPYNPHYSH